MVEIGKFRFSVVARDLGFDGDLSGGPSWILPRVRRGDAFGLDRELDPKPGLWDPAGVGMAW